MEARMYICGELNGKLCFETVVTHQLHPMSSAPPGAPSNRWLSSTHPPLSTTHNSNSWALQLNVNGRGPSSLVAYSTALQIFQFTIIVRRVKSTSNVLKYSVCGCHTAWQQCMQILNRHRFVTLTEIKYVLIDRHILCGKFLKLVTIQYLRSVGVTRWHAQ